MNLKLLFQAIYKYFLGLIIVGVLLFIPAGTFKFFNAWLFIWLLFIPMFVVGIILYFKNPKLLELRLINKEKETDQKLVLLLSAAMFISGFILAGLNFRYKWIIYPNIVTIIGVIIFIISYIMYGEILRENTYLSRTIDVVKGQKVIDTGFYSVIRHPMYIVTILLFLSIPIILGSLYSLIVFMIYPILVIIRINGEEKILEKELKDYKKYKKKVKYRLIPYIW